jgi:hypothetical protein
VTTKATTTTIEPSTRDAIPCFQILHLSAFTTRRRIASSFFCLGGGAPLRYVRLLTLGGIFCTGLKKL